MEVRTPHEIEAEVGLTEGNIFQGELTIDQLLFNRPFPGYAQYRMPVKNMYMCGSSTHPGGGVSAACGANAAREILRDLKRLVGTANRRISNKKFRMMKCGIAALSLFSKIIMIEYLTSIFIIPCSIFVIRFFRV